jgi:hemoglobin
MTPDFPPADAPLFIRLGGRERIKDLLTKFYSLAGENPVVGPIFNAAIHDWSHHIDHVTDFWSTQTGGPALYPGGMGRHIRLGLDHEHFAAWLTLWEKNCRAELPEREAGEMIAIARIFAVRLKEMTGNSGIRIHPRQG